MRGRPQPSHGPRRLVEPAAPVSNGKRPGRVEDLVPKREIGRPEADEVEDRRRRGQRREIAAHHYFVAGFWFRGSSFGFTYVMPHGPIACTWITAPVLLPA